MSLASSEMGQEGWAWVTDAGWLSGVPCKSHRSITDDLVELGTRQGWSLMLVPLSSGSFLLAAQFHIGIGPPAPGGRGWSWEVGMCD